MSWCATFFKIFKKYLQACSKKELLFKHSYSHLKGLYKDPETLLVVSLQDA